jgi:thermitase
MKIKVMISILLSFVCAIPAYAGLTAISIGDGYSFGSYYHNEDSVIYCTAMTIKFDQQVVDLAQGVNYYDLDDIDDTKYSAIYNALDALDSDYQLKKIIKQVPNADWGETTETHIRTGATVTVINQAQLFYLDFTNAIPVDSTITAIKNISGVAYIHEPPIFMFFDEPNDPDYEDGYGSPRWYWDSINADEAWDLTHGSSSIEIAIVDNGSCSNHEDLSGKFTSHDGVNDLHGTMVASVAGATTDNATGIASLAWNTKLRSYGLNNTHTLANNLYLAARYSEVINCSWGTFRAATLEDIEETTGCGVNSWRWVGSAKPASFQEIEDEIANAVSMGVIVVAAAGNNSQNYRGSWYGPNPQDCDPCDIPYTPYPASYSGVIGVSATGINAYDNEVWVGGINYGSFVDIAAPGTDIYVAYDGGGGTCNDTDEYAEVNGTSFAAPFVSGLAALIIAFDPYEDTENMILDNADELSGYTYPSQYLGAGRINAEAALLACFPATPTGFSVTGSSGQHPYLSWNLNPESDIDGYKIYRSLAGGAYSLLASVGQTIDDFTDSEVTISTGKFDDLVCYKILAYDEAGLESEFTSSGCKRFDELTKRGADASDTVPIEQFHLYSAYPNPFNTSTRISFDIPSNSGAIFQISDVTGRIVYSLADGTLHSGHYSFIWSGKSNGGVELPAGIYMLHLTSSNFRTNQKILLLK